MKRQLRKSDAADDALDPEDAPTQPFGKARDDQPPDFFSVDTVAGILRVDRKTVYDAIKTGALRALRLGRVIRIPASAIAQLAGGAFTGGGRRRRAR
jgi:excisionase family DNA binding protein